MKKPILTLAAASVLVLAGSAVAVAATSTPTDVQTLASAESHVVTLLHNYSNTPAWKAEYKAAVATQNGDVAKVNADLFTSAKSTSLTWTTSGSLDTRPFFVKGTFTLSWTTKPDPFFANDCNQVVDTLVYVYPAGTNTSTGQASAGGYSQASCQPYSTQVSGVSGWQFLDIFTENATVVVKITGPVTA
jgi:hypothetical protein